MFADLFYVKKKQIKTIVLHLLPTKQNCDFILHILAYLDYFLLSGTYLGLFLNFKAYFFYIPCNI